MAAIYYILLLLPTLTCAKINVEIVASLDEGHRAIHVSGSNVDVITDLEKNTFGLNDEGLMIAVQRYFGKKPSNAYLHSPTPWNDLYQSFDWPQVSRILTPQRARILSVKNEPTIVLTQIFHNNNTKQIEFSADIKQDVLQTVSSFWEKDNDLSVDQDIQYEVNIELASSSAKTSFSYTRKWGQSASESQAITLGTQSGVTISLDPNQIVTAELYATKGTMKIQIDYEASLSGSVAVNYDETYKGHHFWSLDVNSVMAAAGMTRFVQSSEVITVGFYSDSRILIRDSDSKAVFYSIPMDLY